MFHALRLLIEKATGWGHTLWIASLKLEKEVDEVLHDSVFSCLMGTGIEAEVIHASEDI